MKRYNLFIVTGIIIILNFFIIFWTNDKIYTKNQRIKKIYQEMQFMKCSEKYRIGETVLSCSNEEELLKKIEKFPDLFRDQKLARQLKEVVKKKL